MSATRRQFLKVAGLGILALSAGPVQAAAGAKGNFQKDPGTLAAKRWAMVIETRKCPPECRDCAAACHRAHNVPAFPDPKDEVKWIWREPFRAVFPGQDQPFREKIRKSPVVVLCNHCAEPACVRVCPTKATFKRADGIIMMDYHRCIGCRFCIAACPYGARSMNFRDPRPFIKKIQPDFPARTKGVVEKCNFCVERLDAGLFPVCVGACREKAMTLGDLEDAGSSVRELLKANFTLRRRAELGTGPQVYYIV